MLRLPLSWPLSVKLSFTRGSKKLNQFIMNEDWHAVKKRCKKYPREAAVWTERVGFFDGVRTSRVLPLHQACALRAPKDVINALIVAYPKGANALETSFKRLPLHIACQNGCAADVIEIFLSYNPLCAQVGDVFGRCPIHYACCNGAAPDVVDLFLSVDPSIATVTDKAGWLPIHVACQMGASIESIQKLLDANPSSLQAMTAKGSTPLKLLCKINCNNKKDIARLLIDRLISLSMGQNQTSSCYNDVTNREIV
uniref:Uncharacterized protein n=1 Tax=Ditylum brightwellii TaxID=49249 RepID=A0A7S4VJH9_9STRA